MAQAARADVPALSDVREERPSLTLVAGDAPEVHSPSPGVLPEPRVGRSGMIGAIVGFVIATIVMTVVCALAGLGVGPAIGIGLFTGFWGGGGFGFMMGATVPLSQYMDATHATHVTRRPAADAGAGDDATT